MDKNGLNVGGLNGSFASLAKTSQMDKIERLISEDQ